MLRDLLVVLATEWNITVVLDKEGTSLPELRKRFYRRLVDAGYCDAVSAIARLVNDQPAAPKHSR